MSYAVAAALQTAIYDCLTGDAALTALVGNAIYDALPEGELPALYVVLGTEDVRDASDKTGGGAEHRFVISVVTERAGFATAKAAAAAVSDALVDADMPLSRGHLVALNFAKARAMRVGDLQKDDPDDRVLDHFRHAGDRRAEKLTAQNIRHDQHHQSQDPDRGHHVGGTHQQKGGPAREAGRHLFGAVVHSADQSRGRAVPASLSRVM